MKKIVSFTVVLFLSSFPLLAFAQETEEKEEREVVLEEVVVTATREKREVRKVPANVTVITEEDIKNSCAKTVLDLLRTEEGIVVRDLLGIGKAQVDLRGFGETGPFNTLVLVDGRRVNEIDLSGVDWTQIPLDRVERVEIVRGTGSVLYGDNAVGGVINIITKTPTEKLTARAGSIFGSYGRFRGEASVGGGHENIAGSLFVSYDSTNGYRDNNEFRTRDVGGKIVFDPTEYFSFNLSGAYHRDDFGFPGTLTEEELSIDRRASKTPLDEAETKDQYLKMGGDLDLEKYGSIVTDFSYRDRKSESKFVSVFGIFLQESETETWAITPRYVLNGQILNHANTLIAGVDIYLSEQDVEAFSGTPLALSGLADIERDSYGVYFNNEFSVLENLILMLGARHERVYYDLEQDRLEDTVRDRLNAYSAGLTFLYTDRSSLFARINRSFRFPLTDELVEIDQSTFQLRLNSDLKPQRGRHYEVGIRHFYAPDVELLRFLNLDIEARATLFRAEIKDEIFFNPTPAPFFGTNVNHPETLHQGVEIGSEVDLFKKLTLFGNYTFEKATFDDDPFVGNTIPAVPRHKANLGFRIYDIIPGLVFSANYNFVGSSYVISDQANQFDKLDKYYTIDARISQEWKWFKAFVGVNNITNQEYSEYAVIGGSVCNFYPAPERNWVAGFEAVF